MKNTFYFQHDYNARNDQKILMLRGEYGNEGYAIFFYLLESMVEEGNGYLNGGAIKGLSLSYNIKEEKLYSIIQLCLKIGLFDEDENGIFNKRMLEHIDFRKDLSEAGKDGARKRWENRVAISHPITHPNAKKRKEKERKEKEIINISFISFWDLYNHKVGDKRKSEKLWNNLNDDERKQIIDILPRYLSTIMDKQFQPHPATYLYQRRWENEIIMPKYSQLNKDSEARRHRNGTIKERQQLTGKDILGFDLLSPIDDKNENISN